MTSLSLPGFSLTLLLLPREPVPLPASSSAPSTTSFDADLLVELFDAPTEAPGWRKTFNGEPEMRVQKDDEKEGKRAEKKETEVGSEVKGPRRTLSHLTDPFLSSLLLTACALAASDPKLFLSALISALRSVIAAEPEITRFDTLAGDGDAGLTLKAGAEGILDAISRNEISDEDVVAAMVGISKVVEDKMGGTSGGLYAILLSALSKGLLQAAKEQKSEVATSGVWARGLEVRFFLHVLTCSANSCRHSSHSTPSTPTLARALPPARSSTLSPPLFSPSLPRLPRLHPSSPPSPPLAKPPKRRRTSMRRRGGRRMSIRRGCGRRR